MEKNNQGTIQVREDLYEMKQHGSLDYPVAVYRIDLNMMYLNLIHWHWHSEIELIIVKEGAAEFSVGNNMYVLSPGDTLFINRNVMHSVHPHNEQNCIFHSIVFSPNYIFGYGHSVFSSAYLLPVTNTPGLRSYVMNDKKEDDHSISMLTSEIIKINLQKSFGYELLTKSYLIQIWLLLLNHIQDLPHDHIPAYDPPPSQICLRHTELLQEPPHWPPAVCCSEQAQKHTAPSGFPSDNLQKPAPHLQGKHISSQNHLSFQ